MIVSAQLIVLFFSIQIKVEIITIETTSNNNISSQIVLYKLPKNKNNINFLSLLNFFYSLKVFSFYFL